MNLRRLALLLDGMGVPLPRMIRALLPKPEPRPVPDVTVTPWQWGLGYSGNAHQRRIERRRADRLASSRRATMRAG